MQRLAPWIVVALALAPACKKKPLDWAQEGSGSAGSGSGSDSGAPPSTGSGPAPASHPISANGSALDSVGVISIGPEHACALAEDKLWCWDPGQPATQLKTPHTLTTIGGAACGLDDDGNLYCWAPKELSAPANSLGGQLTASGNEVCAGHRLQIKCWHPGDTEPHAAFDWAGVDKIVLGDGKLCSAVAGGSIECADITSKEPHADPVAGPQDLAAFAMSGRLACGAYTKGSVECWTDPNARKAVPTVDKATDIAVGPSGDACAIVGSGFVTCWHADASSGAVVEASVKQIGGVRGASAIGVGVGYGCALAGDGKVVCWGKASKEPLTAQAVSKK